MCVCESKRAITSCNYLTTCLLNCAFTQMPKHQPLTQTGVICVCAQLFVWHSPPELCCHIVALVSRCKSSIMWLVCVLHYPAWITSQRPTQSTPSQRQMDGSDERFKCWSWRRGDGGALLSMHTITRAVKTQRENTNFSTVHQTTTQIQNDEIGYDWFCPLKIQMTLPFLHFWAFLIMLDLPEPYWDHRGLCSK